MLKAVHGEVFQIVRCRINRAVRCRFRQLGICRVPAGTSLQPRLSRLKTADFPMNILQAESVRFCGIRLHFPEQAQHSLGYAKSVTVQASASVSPVSAAITHTISSAVHFILPPGKESAVQEAYLIPCRPRSIFRNGHHPGTAAALSRNCPDTRWKNTFRTHHHPPQKRRACPY